MAFHSRRLLPQTLIYFSPSPSPSPSPFPFPFQSPSTSNEINCFPSNGINCPWPYVSPPPPSFPLPSPSSPGRSPFLSTPGILAVSIVSSLFLLTIYFILLARYRRNRPNARGLPHGPPPSPGDNGRWTDGEEWNQNQAMVHPIWLINSVGLQPAVIGSIAVCEYRKGEGLIEGDYCSICLSEFEDGESLRLLPKCSHAFHIPCIDTWLRSHTNCPLCRAPILAPLPVSGSLAVLELNGSGSGSGIGEDARENAEGGDTAREDMGDSGSGDEGGQGEVGLNEKLGLEEDEAGASIGRQSFSMDSIAIGVLNLDREDNERGQIGGVRSLPGSGRFRRSGSR